MFIVEKQQLPKIYQNVQNFSTSGSSNRWIRVIYQTRNYKAGGKYKSRQQDAINDVIKPQEMVQLV